MILRGESGASYRIEGPPAAIGGQAIVYRAVALDDDRVVALKVAQAPDPTGDGAPLDAGHLDRLAAHPVVGPRVAPIWDRGWWDDRRFVVLDWYPDTLATWAARHPLDDRLRAAVTLLDVVDALARAGVVHGDLKPGNVLLRDDDPEALVLTDFGGEMAQDGTTPFTRGFAPSEQVNGGRPSPAWDRFALAATLWQVVVGQPAAGVGLDSAGVRPDDQAAFDRAAPGRRGLRTALEAHLRADVSRRPTDLSELRRALLEPPGAQERRPWWPVLLGAAAIGVALTGLALTTTRTSGDCPTGFDWTGSACSAPDGRRVVRIPAGRFVAGRLDDVRPDWTADAAPHAVDLTRSLWASDAEVTQAEWSGLMGFDPVAERVQTFGSGVRAPCATWLGHDLVGPRLPVVCVSWFEAIDYANALSRRDGLEPAYTVTKDGDGPPAVAWDRDAPGWRLPTEAEWEWMARAGTTQPWVTALDRELICPWANVRDAGAAEFWGNEVACRDGFPTLAPVRSLLPNPWGLYDTLGNVLEWVWDLYGPYPDQPVVDPAGPAGGTSRVLRGASWNHVARGVDARYAEAPGDFVHSIGFRVVRTASDPLRPRSEVPPPQAP